MTSSSWRSDQICRAMVAWTVSCSGAIPAASLAIRSARSWSMVLPSVVSSASFCSGPGVRDRLRGQLGADPLVDADPVDLGEQLGGGAEA